MFLLLACTDAVGLGTATLPRNPRDHDHPASAPDTGSPPVDTGEPADEATATEEDDAVVVSATFPSSIACDGTDLAVVTVRNTGTATWTRDGGYKLGTVGDQDDLYPGDTRVWLAEGESVAPGEMHSFTAILSAPTTSGTYTTDWQMVHEGVRWFGDSVAGNVSVDCSGSSDGGGGGSEDRLPLPDHSWVVDEVHAANPGLIDQSCVDSGGNWLFLEAVVARLQVEDPRWGYNWKRGVVGDASQDVVDYHYGSGERELSTDVYIIDMIVGHCGDDPQPGWTDVTQATLDGGTVGMWSSYHE